MLQLRDWWLHCRFSHGIGIQKNIRGGVARYDPSSSSCSDCSRAVHVGNPLAADGTARRSLQPAMPALWAERCMPTRIPDKILPACHNERRGERRWREGGRRARRLPRTLTYVCHQRGSPYRRGRQADQALLLGLQLSRPAESSRRRQRQACPAEPHLEAPDPVHVVRADYALQALRDPQRALACLVLSVRREAEVALARPLLRGRPGGRGAEVAADPKAPAERDHPVVDTRSDCNAAGRDSTGDGESLG
jgi:hypothetical protein